MSLQALDELGNPVDWAFAYKVPLLSGGAQNDPATGYEYAYSDSNNPKPSKSAHRLDQESGAIHETLAQLKNSGVSYLLYNDEMPDSVGKPDNDGLGHTKGIIAWDVASKTGFWLVHSWPKFPDLDATAAPTPIYGQTFLCLSLNLDALEQIAGQMLCHQEPQVYKSYLAGAPPINLHSLALGNLTPHPHPAFDALPLKTLGGMDFTVLAKNREWQGDFWNGSNGEGVGPALGVDLNVETWIRGPIAPTLDADGLHRVTDIKFINMGPLGMHWNFSETSDHSKYGLSVDPSKPLFVCGDINRMLSQRKRGGGAVAFANLDLWAALSKIDLVMAAPGMTREQTHAHLKTTHSKA